MPPTKKPRPRRLKTSASYATREAQVAEVLEHTRRRDRRVAKALVDVLTGAPPRMLTAFGLILDFVATEARVR